MLPLDFNQFKIIIKDLKMWKRQKGESMKKLIFFISIFAYGQSIIPIKSYFGLNAGINYSIFDPVDEGGNYSGTGLGAGMSLGLEVLNLLCLQVSPSFRTTSFNRTIVNAKMGANYKNFYLPFEFLLKAGMMPVVSPYLGLGIAENYQLSGEAYLENISTNIEDLENDTYFLCLLGTEIKLIKLKISPNFRFGYNLTADDPDTQNRSEKNYEFDFTLGFYYSP